MINLSLRRRTILILGSLMILLFGISATYSQTGCQTDDGDTVGHLPKGKTVYYTFVGISGTQKTQVETAFSTWQSANTLSIPNCSAVSFAPGPAPTGGVTITISMKK